MFTSCFCFMGSEESGEKASEPLCSMDFLMGADRHIRCSCYLAISLTENQHLILC